MGDPKDAVPPTRRVRTEPVSLVGLAPTLGSNPSAGPAASSTATARADDRYALLDALGEGGMGKVVLCSDHMIGRRVAMKQIHVHNTTTESETRFLREARIQGQLEHPAIVPVYDLGRGGDGAAFFTMKRVAGVTMREIIEQLRHDDPAARERYTLRRLLSAFSSVCLAVDFAHQRGVLHRDLKPANLMLGDFGEVYVLDWGIARLLTDAPEAAPPLEGVHADLKLTAKDKFVGTLGYSSPEQMAGRALDATSDVYSLGALLFELLTLEPLHYERFTSRILEEIERGVDARCSVRAPERGLPPELDAICVQATAADPGRRFVSARALHEAIEHYLDGERDLELRTAMAKKHVEAARAAIDDLAALGDDDRQLALREIGRALSLDPQNRDGLSVLVAILSQPLREVPRQVKESLEVERASTFRHGATMGALSWGHILLMAPLILWAGVRNWSVMLAFSGSTALLIGALYYYSRRHVSERPESLVALGMSTVTACCASALFGSLLFVPAIIAVCSFGYCFFFPRELRWAVLVMGAFSMLAPLFAQELGLLPSSYSFVGGDLVIHPIMADFEKLPTLLLLALAGFTPMISAGIVGSRTRDWFNLAQQRLHEQRWQLSQMVPSADEARAQAP